MAKDPKTVSKFLSDLSTKLQTIWLKEKEEMLELKKKEASFRLIFQTLMQLLH